MSRFDYVKYDELATAQQACAKSYFTSLDAWLSTALLDSRAKSLVFTKLEEAYMWVGKAIRDEQVKRNAATELQESRGNE